MKLATISAALFVVGSCLGASIATAATCNGTQGTISAPGTVAGNSCGNNANFNGGTFCNGVSFSNTGTDAWQIGLAANQSFTMAGASPGAAAGQAFAINLGLISTNCADNAACVTDVTNDNGAVTSGTISGNPAGTYFIIVTDSTGLGTGCGTYDLTIAGTLPVKLENFSVD